MIAKPLIENTISYYQDYIGLVFEKDLIEALENNRNRTVEFFLAIPESKINYSYDIDKWSVKQVFQHILDVERIFAYRAMRFSRYDATELPGYEDEAYVSNSNSVKRTLSDMLDEFQALRNASIYMYKSMSEDMLDFKGTANSNSCSARICGWLSIGHAVHHSNVVEDKYLDLI